MTTPDDDAALPEQLRLRREKRARLIEAGNDPYAISVDRTHSASQVHEQWGVLSAGEETSDVLLIVDGLEPLTTDALHAAGDALVQALTAGSPDAVATTRLLGA